MKPTRNGKQNPRAAAAHARTPSPSCLFFLFADRLPAMAGAEPLSPGFEAERPTPETIGMDDLLLIVALWSLRERSMLQRDRFATGEIELQVDVPKRPWYCPRRDHWRNLYDSGVMGDVGLLEHAVLVLIRGGCSTVSSIMCGALEAFYPGSLLEVPRSEAREEARYLGYLDKRSRPIGPKVAGLEPDFVDAVTKWNAFRRGEEKLVEAMVAGCQVGRRTYAESSFL